MKTIIFVHLLNDRSGSPKVLSQIVKNFKWVGDIELYTSKDNGFLSNLVQNHHTIFYKRFSNKFLTLFSYLASQIDLFFKVLKYHQDEIIYINTLLPFGGAIAAKLRGLEVIYHIHETSIKPNILKKFLRYIVEKTASKVVFVSNDLASKEAFQNISSFVIYNALEKQFLSTAFSNTYWHLYDGKFIVMMVCSLKDYKGVREFINIAKSLEEESRIAFRLILSTEQEEISSYFSEINIPKNTTILSKQNKLEVFYSKSSLVLNLSRVDQYVETFGLTIIEALAYGIPVIVPPVGGPTEIVESDKEGYLISSYEVEEISRLILELSTDEEKCILMSKNAREKAKQFSEELFLESIKKVIDEKN